jgi:glycosyltransferase involved in cell wall biosynthesis
MKKNILILDTGKEWGGGTNSLLELLKRVNKKKFSFSVLFYINYQKGNESCIKQEIEKLGIEFLLLEREPTSFLTKIPKEIARILFFFSKKIQKKLIFYVDYQSRIKKDANRISAILIKRKIDLIYMNNQPSSNLEGILASEMTGIPSLQHARIETTLKPYEVKASNRTLSKIICVSEGVKNNFVKNGINESKCVVVHNGISSETKPLVPSREIKAKWGIADTDIVIGTVGSLIKRKRVKDLIEIMHIIATTADYSVKCLIIGEGPERNNLVNLAKKKKLYDKIIFTGFQVDAVSYIKAMDIFVMTSEKEGLSRVILEAMLMGRPVVSHMPSASDLIVDRENGMLVPHGNTGKFATSIIELVEHPEFRKSIGQNAHKQIIEAFSIEKYVNGVETVFAEILG